MPKIEKIFKSYRDQLLHLGKLYGVVEIKSYARSSKRLTITQLELLLIKNGIKLPINRSSDKAIAKQELKENSIRNFYLSIAIVFFIGCMIATRPYIKNVVDEVKFTYVAEEYKTPEINKSKKVKNKITFFSKRFAAKEAFSKALGTGFRETLNFKDISISNNKNGKPFIKINNKLHNLINKKFKTKKINVLLSISDERKHSIAFVILEKK